MSSAVSSQVNQKPSTSPSSFEAVFGPSCFRISVRDLEKIKRFEAALGRVVAGKNPKQEPGERIGAVLVKDTAKLTWLKDYNLKLCDFGLITGGIFPDRTIYWGHHVLGCYGYIDAGAFYTGPREGFLGFLTDGYSDKQDVFAFGAILVNLISKRIYNAEDRQTSGPAIHEWAYREFEAYDEFDSDLKTPKISLVHQSLAAKPYFDPAHGHMISALAIECIRGFGYDHPTMKQVPWSLLKQSCEETC